MFNRAHFISGPLTIGQAGTLASLPLKGYHVLMAKCSVRASSKYKTVLVYAWQGTWMIHVEKEELYPQLVHTTTFEVKKYVLPRFQLTINSPGYILADTENVTWNICAKYRHISIKFFQHCRTSAPV